jgi:hypothetical protein
MLQPSDGQKIEPMKEAMKRVDEKIKIVVEEKMQMELQIANIIDEHNSKVQATRLRMANKKNYDLRMEKYPQYALGAIFILLAL